MVEIKKGFKNQKFLKPCLFMRILVVFSKLIKYIKSCSLGGEGGNGDTVISYRVGVEGKVTAIRFEKVSRLLIYIVTCMYKLVGKVYSALPCEMIALIIKGDIDIIERVKLEELILLYQRPNII